MMSSNFPFTTNMMNQNIEPGGVKIVSLWSRPTSANNNNNKHQSSATSESTNSLLVSLDSSSSRQQQQTINSNRSSSIDENPDDNATMGPPKGINERYKTETCRSYESEGECKYGKKCQYAHGESELRSINRHPKYKTKKCQKFYTTGFCNYGPRCHFIHNVGEMSIAAGGVRVGDFNSPLSTSAVINASLESSSTISQSLSSCNQPQQEVPTIAAKPGSILYEKASMTAAQDVLLMNENPPDSICQQTPLLPTTTTNTSPLVAPLVTRMNRSSTGSSYSSTELSSSCGDNSIGSSSPHHQTTVPSAAAGGGGSTNKMETAAKPPTLMLQQQQNAESSCLPIDHKNHGKATTATTKKSCGNFVDLLLGSDRGGNVISGENSSSGVENSSSSEGKEKQYAESSSSWFTSSGSSFTRGGSTSTCTSSGSSPWESMSNLSITSSAGVVAGRRNHSVLRTMSLDSGPSIDQSASLWPTSIKNVPSKMVVSQNEPSKENLIQSIQHPEYLWDILTPSVNSDSSHFFDNGPLRMPSVINPIVSGTADRFDKAPGSRMRSEEAENCRFKPTPTPAVDENRREFSLFSY